MEKQYDFRLWGFALGQRKPLQWGVAKQKRSLVDEARGSVTFGFYFNFSLFFHLVKIHKLIFYF